MKEWIQFLLIILAFWSFMIIAKPFLPKSIEVRPFYLMWRTTRFNKFIEKSGDKLKSFWKIIWNIGIAICLGGSIYITYILSKNLYSLLFNIEEASPVSLLIPGITITPTFNTLFFFSLSIVIILISHEFSHGVAARAEGIKIKSTGLILLAIIPGAFVEPDEESLNNSRKISQARVYAAGSTANIIIALIALILLLNGDLLISPFYETSSSGILITGIVPGSPADGILNNWDVIIGINEYKILEVRDLEKILKSINPGSLVELHILRGGKIESLNMILGKSPTTNYSYIGVYIYPYYAPKYALLPSFLPFYLFNSLNWIYMLSLSVGLINIMPIPALDGDKLINVILKYLFKNRSSIIYNVIRWYCLMILILNISFSFIAFPSFKLS
ncbi:MAG: site-2 protease family protein [Candidatus Methanomethylicaceae archaeon]|nr:site-2 protease family protein [Candidatus Verstraetearchaeota archaeon]